MLSNIHDSATGAAKIDRPRCVTLSVDVLLKTGLHSERKINVSRIVDKCGQSNLNPLFLHKEGGFLVETRDVYFDNEYHRRESCLIGDVFHCKNSQGKLPISCSCNRKGTMAERNMSPFLLLHLNNLKLNDPFVIPD